MDHVGGDAGASSGDAVTSLTSTFKDMMKKDKKNSVSEGDGKKVTVEIDGKKKSTGQPRSKKSAVISQAVSVVSNSFCTA
jgi:hypothetical protein